KNSNVTDESQPKPEITVWTKDRHDMEFWTKKIEEFNESNEYNIMVRYQVFSENYTQAVSNALNTSNAPDLIAYTNQVFIQGMDSYADIMPYMDEDFKETFSQAMIDNVNVIDGRCYYIPTAATTCRLFYNKTIFEKAGIEKAPETMEELIEDAMLITDKLSNQGIYGFGINFKNAESALNRSLMKQGNSQLGLKGGFDFSTGQFDFVSYESLIEKWRILLSSECAYPECDALDIDPLRKLFAAGKVGMYMSYSHSEFGAYLNQYPMKDEWACVGIPTEYGMTKGAQNYTLNNGYLFNSSSTNLEEAWIVYRNIFANVNNLKEYYRQGLGVSIIEEVVSDTEYNDMLAEHGYYSVSDKEKMWPSTPLENGANDFSVDGLSQYETLKQLILGTQQIHDALCDLTERYNRAYNNALNRQNAERIFIEDFNPYNPGEANE
ncbi:MAG: extracellular solute-binding protein, partial [Eubacteriales bacterium]|nr:extracellular solute-binding protein [Eubacteriales bacterium]